MRPDPPVSVEAFQLRRISVQLIEVAVSPDGVDGDVWSGALVVVVVRVVVVVVLDVLVVVGFDQAAADAERLKFIPAAFTPAQIKELVQIPPAQ